MPTMCYRSSGRLLAEVPAEPLQGAAPDMSLVALRDFPQVASGDDLAAFVVDALMRMELNLRADDVLVV